MLSAVTRPVRPQVPVSRRTLLRRDHLPLCALLIFGAIQHMIENMLSRTRTCVACGEAIDEHLRERGSRLTRNRHTAELQGPRFLAAYRPGYVTCSECRGRGEEQTCTNTGHPFDFVCSINGNKSRASGEGGGSGKATEQVARHRLETRKKMAKRTTAPPYRYPDQSRRAEWRRPTSAQTRFFRNLLG